MPNDYLLITPMRDEIDSLLKLKETVLNQTCLPILWVIVDSGSTDGSYELALKIFSGFEWIEIVKQKHFFDEGYGHKNFAQAINEGFAFAKKSATEKGHDFQFIGKTDATPILAKDYFERLINEMRRDRWLAITCGKQKVITAKGEKEIKPIEGLALTGFNDMRLYDREFFERIGGYPLSFSPDTVLLIKARKMGRGAKIIPFAIFEKHRLGGSKIGIFEGNKMKGKAMYCLGYHPLLVLFNAIDYSYRSPPHYQGVIIIEGFVEAALRRVQRIEDVEIIRYFEEERLKEVASKLFLGRNSGALTRKPQIDNSNRRKE